jgi:hypothetical protein
MNPTYVFSAVAILSIGYLVWQYNKKGAFYEWTQDPTYENFKKWYAEVAKEVWGNIIFSLVFAALPLPYLTPIHEDFVHRFLSSMGLYYVSLALILGKPSYNLDQPRSTETVYGFGALISALMVYSTFYNSDGRWA